MSHKYGGRRLAEQSTAIIVAMRALVQRVSRASVRVQCHEVSAIGAGLLVLLGVGRGDDAADVDRLAEKVLALRVFADDAGHMNLPLGGRELLCVSQFTLYADTASGNRPSFARAAPADQAKALYERFLAQTGAAGGVFGAHMEVELVNDGPVTLLLSTDPIGG